MNSPFDIFNDIKRYVDPWGIEVNISTHLIDDLEMDELDITEVIMFLEDKYHINISEDKIRDISTVEDLVKVVKEKITPIQLPPMEDFL